MTTVLGEPISRPTSAWRAATWDLPSGAQVIVRTPRWVVVLKLVSRRMADQDRLEDYYGIDPNRIPGTD